MEGEKEGKGLLCGVEVHLGASDQQTKCGVADFGEELGLSGPVLIERVVLLARTHRAALEIEIPLSTYRR